MAGINGAGGSGGRGNVGGAQSTSPPTGRRTNPNTGGGGTTGSSDLNPNTRTVIDPSELGNGIDLVNRVRKSTGGKNSQSSRMVNT